MNEVMHVSHWRQISISIVQWAELRQRRLRMRPYLDDVQPRHQSHNGAFCMVVRQAWCNNRVSSIAVMDGRIRNVQKKYGQPTVTVRRSVGSQNVTTVDLTEEDIIQWKTKKISVTFLSFAYVAYIAYSA